jgi:mannose-6-phosphate isomerase
MARLAKPGLLSDRDDHPSVVADGPLKGKNHRAIAEAIAGSAYGKLAGRFPRFPLLLKFLDVSKALSVQVHPSDAHLELIPGGDRQDRSMGGPGSGCRKPHLRGPEAGTTADNLRGAIANGKVEDHLA